MGVTSNKCELIGLHTGDGTLYQTPSGGKVWELRGSPKEKEFYDNHICKLLFQIFNVNFKPKYRAGGSYGIQTCNKELIKFLINMGFPVGSKVYTAKVPDFVFKTTKENQLAFLRGLFDTNGCISFEKKYFNRIYPKICFGFASVNLRDTLRLLLEKLNFKPTIFLSKSFRKGTLCYQYQLRLFGKQQANKFFKQVSPKNSKHLNKYFLQK